MPNPAPLPGDARDFIIAELAQEDRGATAGAAAVYIQAASDAVLDAAGLRALIVDLEALLASLQAFEARLS